MSSFLSIHADKSSTTVFRDLREVLDPKHLIKIAKEVGLVKRMRMFNPVFYLLLAVEVCMVSPKEREFRLLRFVNLYNERYGTDLAAKNIYDQLCKPEMLEFTTRITKEALGVVAHKLGVKIRSELPEDLNKLLEMLKVEDIILIDGVEISLYPGCIDNFDCKGKGRKTKEGEEPKPGMKLHVAFSLVQMSFEYVEVTGACGSERAQVLPERFKNCLLIMDRGYVEDELEQNIKATGNKFLIKGKRNMAGEIVRAYDKHGKERERYRGWKVSELPKDVNLDMDVKLANGEIIRVIQRIKTRSRNNDSPVTILRTSLKRKEASLEQVFEIYRIRWQVELGAKCLKSGNSLHSINSEKLDLILTFITFTLLASLYKSYLGMMAIIRRKIKNLSLLKVQCNGLLLQSSLSRLVLMSRNTVNQTLNETLDLIERCCCRTAPSKRDKELGKDLPTLVHNVVNQENIWANQRDAA